MPNSPKFSWAGCEHSLLTETTAMACWSWSLPAKFTCPGMVARDERDICYGCYAQIGCYTYPTTMGAQAARYARLRHMMKTKAGRAQWVREMVAAIKRCATNGRFRWHDSGDVFSAVYCRMIAAVCKQTPDVRHWLPTRSWRLKRILPELVKLHALPNVQVRPSALQFGESPPRIKGLGKGSTAHLDDQQAPKGARVCPKADKAQEGKSCAEVDCGFLCWDDKEGASYLVHGRRGTQYVHHATDKENGNRLRVLQLKMQYTS